MSRPAAAAASSTSRPPPLFCDICWGKPHFQGLHFQQCRTCGVGMHRECYGTAADSDSSTDSSTESSHSLFECWACRAVGTEMRGRVTDPNSTTTAATTTSRRKKDEKVTVSVSIETRPTECCLCGVDDGTDWFHAMHPVFDRHGPSGRPVILPPADDDDDDDSSHSHNKPLRIAWAHTLCCLAIGSDPRTAGVVFGCTADGSYDGEEEEEEEDDDRSVNSQLHPETDDESITHFVVCIQRHPRDPENAWTRTVREHQQNLKCSLCGKDDSRNGSLRIALQCSANDPHEFDDFRNRHPHLGGNETCYVALHVGCALWGRNDAGQLPALRQVYFFPGRDAPDDDDDEEPRTQQVYRETRTVFNLFCLAHAQDLACLPASNILRYPPHLLPATTATTSSSTTSEPSGRTATQGAAASSANNNSDRRLARVVERAGRAKFRTAPKPQPDPHPGGVRARILAAPRRPSLRAAPPLPVLAGQKRRFSGPTPEEGEAEAISKTKKDEDVVRTTEPGQLRPPESTTEPAGRTKFQETAIPTPTVRDLLQLVASKRTTRPPPPPPPPSLADISLKNRPVTNRSGGVEFFFTTEKGRSFGAHLYAERDPPNRAGGLLPGSLIEPRDRKVEVQAFSAFLSDKQSRGDANQWRILSLRLRPISERDSREHGHLCQEYGQTGKERVAMFALQEGKAFLVTPQFHRAAGGLTFESPTSSYLVVLIRKA